MTSFLDTTINKYKQLLVNFGHDKLDAGVFVVAGNECENTKAVLEKTGATVKICNGENPIEEVMEIVDEAELPHCFLINVNPLKENEHLKPEKIQEIFGVVHNKMMRSHFYVFNTLRPRLFTELDAMKKAMNSFGRQYEMTIENYSDKEKLKYTTSFAERSATIMIYPPE